ncbi:uncharacterized protein LOC117100492 isoform X2 [Anneissia japonica]|uniref:uncharacterized protein LOC117100492 isoform X2 n=1 Tax=Anneissia japonica TaxID=1529436 RepID=UPI00142553A7|nr:uncharacterized protein LOC117100492 isoform X2 [Anneissia japonica]
MDTCVRCVGIWLLMFLINSDSEAATYFSDGNECKRECKWPAEPAVCRFNFTVEWYYPLSKACYRCPLSQTDCDLPHCIALNGVKRPIMVANRQLPGPLIQVCEGDTIEVEVKNRLPTGEGTSIHWHGLHSRGNPYMDGVPMLTQCPITSRTNFLYSFQAEPAGTHWWHSEAGTQRANGLFGALIVRQAQSRDTHYSLYDYDLSEHTIIVNDWFNDTFLDNLAECQAVCSFNPDTVLINGKGKFDRVVVGRNSAYTPRETFSVQQNFRYRFRMISSGITDCGLTLSIDSHTMTVIASDGAPIEPIETNKLLIYGGERFDFILTSDKNVDNYWIRVQESDVCNGQRELAILRYAGAPTIDPDEDETMAPEGGAIPGVGTVNTLDSTGTPVVQLNSLDDDSLSTTPTKIFYIAADSRHINDHFNDPLYYPRDIFPERQILESPQLDNITFIFPSSPPLFQFTEIPENEICAKDSLLRDGKNCADNFCECTHTLDLDMGDDVEIILVNEAQLNASSHHFHLHGYHFRVVGQGTIAEKTTVAEVKELDRQGSLPRKLQGAPKKDTVIVPSGGYVILRIHADNPGWWIFHCESEQDAELGMSLVLHVGEDSDLPAAPEDFPRCESWPKTKMQDKPTYEAATYFSDGNECKRECKWPAEPAVCRFNFTVEWYYPLSKACFRCPHSLTDCNLPHCIALNGVKRPILVANRQLPGPMIQVCEGDTIEVEVKNRLPTGEGTSIHWHGLHARGNPYMDGVPMLTQCPIPSRTDFLYSFQADPAGTHWWHSHAGPQRADGLFGALIVRQAQSRDTHYSLYDYDLSEHTIIVHDWLNNTFLNKFAECHAVCSFDPDTVLINGKGKFEQLTLESDMAYTPRETFTVMQNARYRFRMISNAITNCELTLSIDGHTMTVIASDGAPIEPIETDKLLIYGGERFDFVLAADQSVSNYWMRVQGSKICSDQSEQAILRYMGAPEGDPIDLTVPGGGGGGVGLRPGLGTVNTIGDTGTNIVQLNSVESDTEVLSTTPDKVFYIAADSRHINDHFNDPLYYPRDTFAEGQILESPQLDNITFIFPSSPPLIQFNDILDDEICTKDTLLNDGKNCVDNFCECTHTLDVDLGDDIELIIVNEAQLTASSHPFHLHGYYFRVVGQDTIAEKTTVAEVKELDRQGSLPRKLQGAVKKDTVIVPSGGYVILRVHADNPGWWLLHCHIEQHTELGMALVLHVGEDIDLPTAPAELPQCGSWTPQSEGKVTAPDLVVETSHPGDQIEDNDESTAGDSSPTVGSGTTDMNSIERNVIFCITIAWLLYITST